MIRALFFMNLNLSDCPWAQPSEGAHAVPMKRSKEGTVTTRSLRRAHEKEQEGHSCRLESVLCPRKRARRAQLSPGAYVVPIKASQEGTVPVGNPICAHEKNKGLHFRKNMV